MPDSQNPEHVRKLIAEFQLKGANLIPTVTGEIVPTVVVADLTAQGPQAIDRLAMGGLLGTASGAGNQNRLALSNPVGSGTLIVMEAFWVETAAADFVAPLFRNFAFTPGGFVQWRDSRLLGDPVGTMGSGVQGALVLGAPHYQTQVTATDSHVQIPLVYTLAPGNSVEFTQNGQNAAINFGCIWRERTLTPGD